MNGYAIVCSTEGCDDLEFVSLRLDAKPSIYPDIKSLKHAWACSAKYGLDKGKVFGIVQISLEGVEFMYDDELKF